MANHKVIPIKIWVEVDENICEDVRFLNNLTGVRTFASCQGTLTEGGPEPYKSYILAYWPKEYDDIIKNKYEIGELLGIRYGYLHPKN